MVAAGPLSGVGSALRFLRESRRRSKGDLAKEIDVDPSTVSHWENGRNYPTWESLEKVLVALDTTLLDLHYAIQGERPPVARQPAAAPHTPSPDLVQINGSGVYVTRKVFARMIVQEVDKSGDQHREQEPEPDPERVPLTHAPRLVRGTDGT